ncbi:hypothetical protein MBLNU230_g8509t1 [Neophaeotheca triangularis]
MTFATDHYTEYPHLVVVSRLFGILKYSQLLNAILILGASIYNAILVTSPSHYYAASVSLFTIVITAYYLVASRLRPQIYNWIALLVLEVFGAVFWTAAWPALAKPAADWYRDGYWNILDVDLKFQKAYHGCITIALVLGIFNFLLYGATLHLFCKAIAHHRFAGKPVCPTWSGLPPPYARELHAEPAASIPMSDEEKLVQESGIVAGEPPAYVGRPEKDEVADEKPGGRCYIVVVNEEVWDSQRADQNV